MKRQMALVSKGIPIRNALDWLLWQTVILSVHVQAQVHVQIGIHRVAADLTKQVTQHQRHAMYLELCRLRQFAWTIQVQMSQLPCT